MRFWLYLYFLIIIWTKQKNKHNSWNKNTTHTHTHNSTCSRYIEFRVLRNTFLRSITELSKRYKRGQQTRLIHQAKKKKNTQSRIFLLSAKSIFFSLLDNFANMLFFGATYWFWGELPVFFERWRYTFLSLRKGVNKHGRITRRFGVTEKSNFLWSFLMRKKITTSSQSHSRWLSLATFPHKNIKNSEKISRGNTSF